MPRSYRSTPAILLLVLHALASGCASTAGNRESTTAGEGRSSAFDAPGFLEGCREGCSDEPALCEAFCTCSVARIEASPELSEAVVTAESEGEQGTAALTRLQTELVGACGAALYEHHFVEGCIDTCSEDGTSTDACGQKCACLFGALRDRHPGSEGMTYLAEAFGAEQLPEEALAEIEAVRPACGF